VAAAALADVEAIRLSIGAAILENAAVKAGIATVAGTHAVSWLTIVHH